MKRNLIYTIHHLSLDPDDLMLNETLFHNANGYTGARSNFEEGYAPGIASIRGQYINGFYDIAEMKQAEKLYGLTEEKQTLLNVADTQGITLMIDGESFSMFEGTVLDSSRTLDMEHGVTIRSVCWRSPKGHEVEIHIKRMASFTVLPLFLIDYTVTSKNFDGELTFLSTHQGEVQNYANPNDPRVAGESFRHLIPGPAAIRDNVSLIDAKTVSSGLTVTTAVSHRASRSCGFLCRAKGSCSSSEITFHISKGEQVNLLKYTVSCDSLRYGDTHASAGEIMQQVLDSPVSKLYDDQTNYLSDFWNSCAVCIDGDPSLNLAVSYNLYQLLQSVGKDAHSNIAAKGLSGEGYEGHYFWDTEMYMMPFFTLTCPEIARSLIFSRYTMLDSARENARILGHQQGAAYAWRTITGPECSGYFPSGSAQYHINGDISYSVVAYYLATNDIDMVEQCGAEMLFEIGRIWLDLGTYHEGTFQIHTVTGPDEYTCLVNNNYYTNALAQHGLRWAVKFYELLKSKNRLAAVMEKIQLKESEIRAFEKAAGTMYLPYDEKLGINPQDDSFLSKKVWDLKHTPNDKFPLLLHYHPMYLYRFQVCKQADTVLAHFILEDNESLETIRRSFAYYETVTTHDSSLSTCIFSIVASRLGLKEKAYDYFGDSAKLDLFNTHKNTKDGIHTANMGGNYMAIVYGFGGLRIKENGLFIAPSLPTQWNGYSFRIQYLGRTISVNIDRQDISLTLKYGEPVTLYLYDAPIQLQDKTRIPLQQQS